MSQFNLDPFVLQPRQVEIKNNKFRMFELGTGKPIEYDAISNKYPSGSDGQKFIACLATQIVTPEAAYNKSEIIYRFTLKIGEKQWFPDPETLPKPEVPITAWEVIHFTKFAFY